MASSADGRYIRDDLLCIRMICGHGPDVHLSLSLSRTQNSLLSSVSVEYNYPSAQILADFSPFMHTQATRCRISFSDT